MVTIESSTERRAGVTLVTATIRDDAAPTRITVESRLDGPVWPPRRQGEPAAGWETANDESGPSSTYEGVVPSDGHLAVGFASPATPADPPVEVTTVAPAEGPRDEMATPTAVLRGLGDPSPPSLVAVEESPAAGPLEGQATPFPAPTDSDESDENDESLESATFRSAEDESADADGSTREQTDPTNREQTIEVVENGHEDGLPPVLTEWFVATERRIECAEGLEATASVEAATEALIECGGIEGARTLDARIATDADHLRTLAARATALAERAESTSVATDALERLG